jgi:GH15 family glucan-1,4-alpha-glucosidase
LATAKPNAAGEPKARGCQPIRDYALIGDCHGAALVGTNGSIDWCCLGRFDAEPALWRLLDTKKGAFFQIHPTQKAAVARAYVPDTNMLRTVFTTPGGRVAITDFMPVGRDPAADDTDYVTLNAPGWLVRVVEGLKGRSELHIEYRSAVEAFDRGFSRDSEAPVLYCDSLAAAGAPMLDSMLTVEAGERRVFVIAPKSDAARAPLAQAERLQAITRIFWEQWCKRCCYQGPYDDMVRRSALVLKALSFAPSGAIVAAPTTSLPEESGGVRNWDYRFSWLRDSSFVLQALAALGYSGEARKYCGYLGLCCVQTLPGLQILYGITGEAEVDERQLDHLEGHGGASPVRVGNAAYTQKQIDIYGEFADWALIYQTLGGAVDSTLETMVREMANHVAEHWHEPDQGIWEMRGEPRPHVHGKAMAWVALDRALRLLGPNPVWEAARAEVLEAVSTRGVDPRGRHLVQAFDYPDLDAALLLITLLGMPLDPELLARTVVAVEQQLRVGDYVHRYLTADGLPGGEGAFLICSFWLVDALLMCGRAEEARALFERLLTKANDVGLYAEEIDPVNGTFLGNYPQAFTHLALINSAIHLRLHEEGGAEALSGTHADRSKRAAERMVHRQALWRDTIEAPTKSESRQSSLDLKSLLQAGPALNH